MSTGLAVVIPSGYEYVALAGISTIFVTAWQGSMVGKNRKLSGIKYPQMYAEKEEEMKSAACLKFNCAQRAHMNTLESYTQTMMALFIAGLKYPLFAASAGALYAVGRVFFTLGYIEAPEKRHKKGGFLATLAQLGLFLTASWTAIDAVRKNF